MHNRRSPFTAAAAGAACAVLALAACSQSAQRDLRAGVIEHPIKPASHLAVTPDLLDLGQRTYQKQCAACHGATGEGNGEASYLLYPRPRDFTSGEFRLVSTWEGVPTDE